ncbi:MAG: hypothetical protein FWG22_01395 [Prolixibacteraceae bacterium]|nr:hypothetical protein [Prolixibacteraceae bacterium]
MPDFADLRMKNDTSVIFEEKRETGMIINDTFRFLRSEWKPLLKLISVYIAPFLIVNAGMKVFVQMKIMAAGNIIQPTDPEKFMEQMSGLSVNLLMYTVFAIFIQSLYVAIICSYIKHYVIFGKNNFSLDEVKTMLFANSKKAVSMGFAAALVCFLGLFLCIAPGIAASIFLSLAVYVAIFEDKDTASSLQSSLFLVRMNVGSTLALLLLGILLAWLASFAATIPIYIVEMFSPLPDNYLELPQWYWWLSGIASLIGSLASIFMFVFLAFQYFNFRIRMENR